VTAINFTLEGSTQMILSGRKNSTIRKHNPEREEQILKTRNLELFWKQRTPECEKIADAVCLDIRVLEGRILTWIDQIFTDKDVYREGFDSRAAMKKFFVDHYTQEELATEDFFSFYTFMVKPEESGQP